MRLMGSLLDPEVTGTIQLSHGEAYLSQEKGLEKGASSPPSTISTTMPGGGYSWMAAAENIARSHTAEVFALPAHHLITKPSGRLVLSPPGITRLLVFSHYLLFEAA